MSTHLRTRHIKKAAKPHGCYFCREPIAMGDPYEYSTGVDCGEFWSIKAHPECAAVAQKNFDDTDWECFEPGSMKRGSLDEHENQIPNRRYNEMYKQAFNERRQFIGLGGLTVRRLQGQIHRWLSNLSSEPPLHF